MPPTLDGRVKPGHGEFYEFSKSRETVGIHAQAAINVAVMQPRGGGTRAIRHEQRQQVLEDVFWALMNSKEFYFNH